MFRLKKFLIFILSAYLFILVSRLPSVLIGNTIAKQLGFVIGYNDLGKQKNILMSLTDNSEFKNVLDNVFKGDDDELLNYLVLFDSTKMFKKYFNVRELINIDEKQKLPILEKALAAGSLRVATGIINKGKVKPTSVMLVNNFDSIARAVDLKKIKNFVNAIKKIQMLRALLEERSIYDEEKDLKGLIHHVAQRCNMNWLKVLVSEGVCVQLQDRHKDTPFHCTVLTLLPDTLDHKIKFINFMIKSENIDVLYKNRDNKTAFDLAEEYLARYKKLYSISKSLLFKNSMEKKVKAYTKLVKVLGQLQRY